MISEPLTSKWWRIWILALFVKLFLAAWLPLSSDEAYYWVWSQHLQLSYFDHPPMVAWLMAVGRWLPEWGQSVRWPAVVLDHVGLWFWAQVLATWLNPLQLTWWLALVLLMPLTGPGSLVVTPDLPLMFSWGLTLWTFQNFLRDKNKRLWALAFGGAIGVGFLSKYTSVILIPILFYWWWTSLNRLPARQWLGWALLAALIVSTPVWLWNWQNDWASFRFQMHHGLGRKYWKPSWTSEYIFAQIGLIFPSLFYFAARAQAHRNLKVAAWLPLVFFFISSFKAYAEVNWPLTAHPMMLALAILGVGNRRWPLVTAGAIWGLGLLMVLFLVGMETWPNWVQETKLQDLRQFDRLTKASRELHPLFARSYQVAAKLSYELKRPVAKLRGLNRFDFYDTLDESLPSTDRFFLLVETGERLPPPWREWRQLQAIPVDHQFAIWELGKP